MSKNKLIKFYIFIAGISEERRHRHVSVLLCFFSFFFFLCLPPTGSGDILFSPCVCPSVRPSVCLSVRHKSCPLYNLKTVKDFSMKLGSLVNHNETMCHAQEP